MNQITLPEKIQAALEFIRQHTSAIPKTGIILGTGLGNLVSEAKVALELNYADIPHFPTSTVETHKGKLVFGTIAEKQVVIMQGRFHYYEGYTMEQVTFPIRVMKAIGVGQLFISNISGSLNPYIKAGELVIINDHINLHSENPLRGKNYEQLGPRWPVMTEAYDKDLLISAINNANILDLPVHEGVYISLPGPNLETNAEYRYLRTIGGDIVGMSTVPECIVAVHSGMKVFAVSVVTDEAFPENGKVFTIQQILSNAANAEPLLAKLLIQMVKENG